MPDGRQGVCRRHTQIVVTVNGNHGLINIGDAVIEVGDNGTELFRQGVAHGIRDVDGSGSGLNGVFNHSAQVVNRRAAGIFAGKLHIVGVVSRLFDAGRGHSHDVIAAFLEFILHVNIGRSNKGVDAEVINTFHSVATGVNIFRHATGKAAGNSMFEAFRDGLNRLKVSLGRNRKSCLNDVNSQLIKRHGNLQFLLRTQTLRQGLLAVSESGVKNNDFVRILMNGHKVAPQSKNGGFCDE